MAFLSPVAWEVRATNGSDTNGGGFDATSGTPGTDFSQQDAAQQAYTDLVIDGATNTKVTSAAHAFGATSVGNILNVTGGTGFTVQRVQIISVTGVTATCDKSLGTLGSTGGTGNLGGALKTHATATGLAVAGNTIWSRYASNTAGETVTTAIQLTNSGDITIGRISLRGYDTTRGDNTGNRPKITTATNSIVKIDLTAKNYWLFENLNITDTAGTRGGGIRSGTAGISSGIVIRNCVIDGCLNGVMLGNIGSENAVHASTVEDCEVKNCTTDGVQLTGTGNSIRRCYIHDNTTNGVRCDGIGVGTNSGGLDVLSCFIAKNGSKGISLTNATGMSRVVNVQNSVIYKNTGDGINSAITTANYLGISLVNNIIYGNGTFGVTLNNTTNLLISANHMNAWGSNTSGDTSNWTKAADDLTLTAAPLTSDTDCTLNATSGGGPVCKAAGFPGVFKGAATNGFIDVNAIQHQDAGAGSSGMLYVPNLEGI